MPAERPTDDERADACDRFVEAEDRGHAAIRDMRLVLRERMERGQSGRTGPLFPWVGDQIDSLIDKAQEALWAAHKLVAIQGYDSRRAAERNASHTGDE